jgi:hypothetical protein
MLFLYVFSLIFCVLQASKAPTKFPTKTPTKTPTSSPTKTPTSSPTLSPTEAPTRLSLCPGLPGQFAFETLLIFDDYGVVRNEYMGQTYSFYNFTAVNTPYSSKPNDQVWITNTESGFFIPEYTNISYSSPCIINTVLNILSIVTYNATRFGFYGAKMRGIYNTVWMVVNGTQNGTNVYSQDVNVTAGSWTSINANVADLDSLTFSCVQSDPALGTCSDVAYDDIDLCCSLNL